MRTLFVVLLLAAATACSPPAAPLAEAPQTEAPAVDTGPYTNQWDSDQFERFNHTLRATAPGTRTITLEASTGGGTETVAVYPADASGERSGGRLLFVVATTGGNRETAQLEIPEAGLPVVVVVENASGRQSTGTYTVTVE